MPEQSIAGGPRWLTVAWRYVGTREIRGPRNEPRITAWLAKLGAWWSDDETPWCGTFVAAMMAESGIRLPQRRRGVLRADRGVPLVGCGQASRVPRPARAAAVERSLTKQFDG